MKFKSSFILILLVALSFWSCKKSGNRDIDQGEIYFNIEYKGKLMGFHKELMPKQMVVSFKDDKILFDITSNIGNSGIKFLSNPDLDISDLYSSLLSYKYYYSAKPGESMPGFSAMEGIEVSKTNRTIDICGYHCQIAEVTFPADRNVVYEVWYTKEIDVDNPNSATPFEEIDGVVMKFFFLIGGIEMHFTAENVYSKEIDDNIFLRRKDYKPATKEGMDTFIEKMINF